MIRLRIGDVIRSNYSRFNLGRLFGLGTASLNYNDSDAAVAIEDYDTILNQPTYDKIKELIETAKTNGGLAIGDIVRLTYPNVQYLEKLPGGFLSDIVDGFSNASTRYYLPYRDVYAKIKKPRPAPGGLLSLLNKPTTTLYEVELFDDISAIKPLTKSTYIMSHHDATIIPEGIAIIKNNQAFKDANSGLENNDILKSFNNFVKQGAVARSFEESGGRGLPGFVSSLSFNWIDNNTTWEVEPGARAPKVCEINISFDPVHDIAPGLDAQGFNRAPTYQVGSISNEIAGNLSPEPASAAELNEKYKAGLVNNRKYNKDTKTISDKMNDDDFRS